jgi:hypothetical protein
MNSWQLPQIKLPPPKKSSKKNSCPSSGPYCRHITTAENQHVTLVLHGIELATPAESQVESSLEHFLKEDKSYSDHMVWFQPCGFDERVGD